MHLSFNTAENDYKVHFTQIRPLSNERLNLNGQFFSYLTVRDCKTIFTHVQNKVGQLGLIGYRQPGQKPRKPADRVLEVNCSVTY